MCISTVSLSLCYGLLPGSHVFVDGDQGLFDATGINAKCSQELLPLAKTDREASALSENHTGESLF